MFCHKTSWDFKDIFIDNDQIFSIKKDAD